tara:strand:- start:182 stop:346 length:165 start_codon:yes stop_codon:yes gene_type:complete
MATTSLDDPDYISYVQACEKKRSIPLPYEVWLKGVEDQDRERNGLYALLREVWS